MRTCSYNFDQHDVDFKVQTTQNSRIQLVGPYRLERYRSIFLVVRLDGSRVPHMEQSLTQMEVRPSIRLKIQRKQR